MGKSSESHKRAVAKYDERSKLVSLKFTENQNHEYYRLKKYCTENSIAIQAYIKGLIKADLDAKGISYIDAGDGSKAKTDS